MLYLTGCSAADFNGPSPRLFLTIASPEALTGGTGLVDVGAVATEVNGDVLVTFLQSHYPELLYGDTVQVRDSSTTEHAVLASWKRLYTPVAWPTTLMNDNGTAVMEVVFQAFPSENGDSQGTLTLLSGTTPTEPYSATWSTNINGQTVVTVTAMWNTQFALSATEAIKVAAWSVLFEG